MKAEVKALVKTLFQNKFFRMLVREWVLHVNRGEDPNIFGVMCTDLYRHGDDRETLECMGDFFKVVRSCHWKSLIKDMAPHLEPDQAAAFRRNNAPPFYDGFKGAFAEYDREILNGIKSLMLQKRISAEFEKEN